MTDREPLHIIRQYRHFALFCVFYILGLVAGLLFVARYSSVSLMRLLYDPQMSIVIGFLVSAFPFIVFYIVFRCSALFMIAPLAFAKAFMFMYCFGGVSVAYADAGWLVRCLLLFTDCFSVPLLIWYVGETLIKKQISKNTKIWLCLFFVFVIRCIDYSVISPFAAKLLSF